MLTDAIDGVVLLSGNGSTFQNLYENARMGALALQIRGVVSSRHGAFGLKRAAALNVPAHVVPTKAYDSPEAHSEEVWRTVDHYKPDIVVLCGWMSLLVLPREYQGRVINIHPSLLPKFGGKGMYGIHVHKAVIAAGERETGCTVHYVDNEYDRGPIVLQKKVWVDPEKDSPEMLMARVQVLEREAYPEAINMIAMGKVRWVDGRVERA